MDQIVELTAQEAQEVDGGILLVAIGLVDVASWGYVAYRMGAFDW